MIISTVTGLSMIILGVLANFAFRSYCVPAQVARSYDGRVGPARVLWQEFSIHVVTLDLPAMAFVALIADVVTFTVASVMMLVLRCVWVWLCWTSMRRSARGSSRVLSITIGLLEGFAPLIAFGVALKVLIQVLPGT